MRKHYHLGAAVQPCAMRDQSRRATRYCTTLARQPHGCTLEHTSDAVIPEAHCRPGSPMPRGERIAKPAEWGTPTWPVLVFPLPTPPTPTLEESCVTPVWRRGCALAAPLRGGRRRAPGALTRAAAADCALSLPPAALTMNQGAEAATAVAVPPADFAGAVPLPVGGAPAWVTGSFGRAAPTGTSSTL